jgi:hypothetical protein
MEFTSSGAPASLHPDHDAFTIIERTLAWGNWGGTRWLFQRHGSRVRSR